MKCLPQNKISQTQGIVLHDWHAEVLAIRSFNRFLIEECHSLASSQKKNSEYIRLRGQHERTESHFQPFALNADIKLHMYSSEAPCKCKPYIIFLLQRLISCIFVGGDASMELTIAAQEDSTPWELPGVNESVSSSLHPLVSASKCSPPTPGALLKGRGYFSALGIVRRKPSRPDAPPTLSKSCSDKIALKQCTSLLSSITSLLISPSDCYLSSLTLPQSQYSAVGCSRAFSVDGRMKPVVGKDWENGYAFRPFKVLATSREFSYSRRTPLLPGEKLVPSNIFASYTPHHFETLIGGILQGRKQGDLKVASRVCNRKMWNLALEIATLVAAPSIERCLRVERYSDVKTSELLNGRRKVKVDVQYKALAGWVKNTGDEDFGFNSVDAL
jgi:tRNA-specific adenosine deaminase 1